jgi:hypothetical protein
MEYLLLFSIVGGIIVSRSINKRNKENIMDATSSQISQNTEKDQIIENKAQSMKFNPKSSWAHPAVILVWAYLSFLIDLVPLPTYPFQNNQLLFFIFGIDLTRNKNNLDIVEKHAKWMLPSSLLCLIVWIFMVWSIPSLNILKYFGAWYFILGLIGVSRTKVKKSSRCFRYLMQDGFAIYIIQLTLEVIVGYFILPLAIPPLFEILLLICINFWLSLELFELIKQFRVTRFLFGIKAKKRIEKQKL